ncbi:hypothetical protein THRCLA_20882 [Thraustotheca clavata]|uniref:Histone chaperone domain-containing protein n=1 Tax=Thraustotheca clavata TaxID=74557 RepID=A0A1W0A2L3_9STRA|nr:hypothetical protein THRCLA_20882 [Thraustotheca clavata]
MLDKQVLRNALKRMLPEMDAATVTLSALKEALHKELGVSHDELKQSKKLVKEVVADLLYLCKNSSSTPIKAAPVPVKKAVVKKSEEEEDVVKRKLSKPKKNCVLESDEEENKPENEQNDDASVHTESENEAPKPVKKTIRKKEVVKRKSSKTKKSRVSDSEDEENESDASPVHTESEHEAPKSKKQRRHRQESEESEGSSSPKKKKTPQVKKPTHNWTSEGYEQLKLLARTAGVLAPAIYKKLREASSLDEAEDILKERLAQANVKWHGKYPGRHDIAALKKKKALAQELDGIDPTLIIDHGPRRPARRVAGVYDLGPKPKFDDENEDSEDESDSGSEASFQLNDDEDEEEVENE